MNLTSFYDFGIFEFKKKIWIKISDSPATSEHAKVTIKKTNLHNEDFCIISCDVHLSYLCSTQIVRVIKKSEIKTITEGVLNRMVNKWFKRAKSLIISKLVVFYFLNRRLRSQRFEFDYSKITSATVTQVEKHSDQKYKNVIVLYPILKNRIFITKNPIYNCEAFYRDVIKRIDPTRHAEKIIFEMDGNKYQMKKEYIIITKRV